MDPLKAVRGIARGLIISAAIWAAIFMATTASAQITKGIRIAWEQDSGMNGTAHPEFAGWKVWRSDTPGGPYEIVTIIPFTGVQTDYQSDQQIEVPAGQITHIYSVLTAYRNDGIESTNSSEIDIEIDLTSVSPPGNYSYTIIIVPVP